MHYLTVCIMPPNITFKQACDLLPDLMAPHQEYYNDEDDHGGIWDWYQVGGRWTGHYSEYDPQQDPRNTDPEMGFGDNKTKWPTDWVEFEGDLVPVRYILNAAEQIPNCHWPVYVWLPNGKHVGHWDDREENKEAIKQALRDHEVYQALVVDIHS